MSIAVLGRVFSQVQYILMAGVVAFIVLSAALLLPNRTALQQVVTSDSIDFGYKSHFIISLFGSLGTNFTFITASYLVAVALLFGVNIALLIFYIRRRQEVGNSKGVHLAGIGGMVSAVLGIGCAACGSVVLTTVFGLLGAGSILSFLPLDGLEFGIVGITLLVLSTHYLMKRINDPLICPIN